MELGDSRLHASLIAPPNNNTPYTTETVKKINTKRVQRTGIFGELEVRENAERPVFETDLHLIRGGVADEITSHVRSLTQYPRFL